MDIPQIDQSSRGENDHGGQVVGVDPGQWKTLRKSPSDSGYRRDFVAVFRRTGESEAVELGRWRFSVMWGVDWQWLGGRRQLRSAGRGLKRWLRRRRASLAGW